MAVQETPGPGQYDTAGSLESWDHAVSFKGVAHLRSHVRFTVTVLVQRERARARALFSVSVRVRVRIRVLWLTRNAKVPQLIMCSLLVYIADAVALTHSLTHSLLLSHTLIQSLTHSLTHSLLTHALNLSLNHSLTHSLTHSLSDARCSPLAIRLMNEPSSRVRAFMMFTSQP
jgi:hypothetical protein